MKQTNVIDNVLVGIKNCPNGGLTPVCSVINAFFL